MGVDAATVGVVIPTYDERDNIAPLVKAVLAAGENVHAVIVDDNSPDGTGRIADALAEENSRVTVIHRYTERGRGTAGRDGFVHCINAGYDYILEMDADFSHDPKDIPRLVAAARDADVVLGSRRVSGGGEEGRSAIRRFITAGASLYLRVMLMVPHVRDCTSGFRCFRREALIAADVASVRSKGPSIVQELLFRCRKMRIVEAPILFRDRAKGESKFGLKAIFESLLMPPKLWWWELIRKNDRSGVRSS